jgi:hypothetical protein
MTSIISKINETEKYSRWKESDESDKMGSLEKI